MADNVTLPGSGALVATDEVTDGTLGTVQVQYLKLMDGTLDGTNKATVTSGGALKVDGSAATQPVSIAAAITANQGSPPWTVKPDGTAWAMTSTSANVNVTNSTLTVAQSGTGWTVASATNPSNSMNSTTANSGVNSAMAAVFDDVAPTAITENNFGFLRMSANRNLYGTIRDAAGNERGVNVTTGNALTVDASATTQPVSIAATVSVGGSTSNASDTVSTGSVSVPTVAYNYGFNGTQWDRLQVDANKFLKVVGVGTYSTAADGVGTIANGLGCNSYNYVFNGSTWDRLRGDTTNGMWVNLKASVTQSNQGDTASGASDAGNPLKIGGLAKTTNPTAVTDGQRVAATFDKQGKLVAVGAIRQLKGKQKPAAITTTTETTIVTAGGAGVFNDVYSILITNTSATATFVDIRDSTGGTIMMTLAAPAGDTRGFTVPVDSAMVQATAANNWTAQARTAVTGLEITTLYVSNL